MGSPCAYPRISCLVSSMRSRSREICSGHGARSPPTISSFGNSSRSAWSASRDLVVWRWKSRPKGRPTPPLYLQELIAEIASGNIPWGEERIAHELLVKLDLRVSPRTVRKYMPCRDDGGGAPRVSSQRWATFVRNHTKVIVAADFLTVRAHVPEHRGAGRWQTTRGNSAYRVRFSLELRLHIR